MSTKGFRLIFALVALTMLGACGKYNYTNPVTEQDKKDNPEIYGEVGGEPLQTKNTYPDNPAAQQRSAVLKMLLFDEHAREKYIDTAKALQSMQE